MPDARSGTAPAGAPPPFGMAAAAAAVGFAAVGLVFFFLIIGAVGLTAAVLGLLAWAVITIAVWRATRIADAPPKAGEGAP